MHPCSHHFRVVQAPALTTLGAFLVLWCNVPDSSSSSAIRCVTVKSIIRASVSKPVRTEGSIPQKKAVHYKMPKQHNTTRVLVHMTLCAVMVSVGDETRNRNCVEHEKFFITEKN